MKNTVAIAVVLLLELVALPGCNSSLPPPKPSVELKSARNRPYRIGFELVRQATEPARYWEGLQLLNSDDEHQAKLADKLHLDAETRKFLQADAGLSDTELEEVDSPTFRQADAHYLAECTLLRDAVRALRVDGQAPEEVASAALAWVNRRVLLHQQGDDWLPPAQVLQRGYGSLQDRQRVFLAMLRQIPMEGCAIVLKEAPTEIVLIGAMPAVARDAVYLFDSRYGSAVRNAKGGIATLAEVRADPKLLAYAGIDAKQLAAAQVRLACPLAALGKRMQHLERELQAHEPIVTFLDASATSKDFARLTGLPVRIWNPLATNQVDNSPTRALHRFLPPDEGGIDKTGRRQRFLSALVPMRAAHLALNEIGVGERLSLVERTTLLRIIEDLLKKFYIQPHDMVLHGKGEEAMRRLGRVQPFFDDENLDGLSAGDPAFQKAVAAWRESLHEAYVLLANGVPDGQSAVNAFWAEDHFVLALLDTDGEDRLNTQNRGGADRPVTPKKSTTTAIVAYAVRERLKQRALWLRAMVWHEKGLREQAKAERETDAARRAQRQQVARAAWSNTRIAWTQLEDRAAGGPAARQQRLAAIRRLVKRGDPRSLDDAAYSLGELHLDLHHQFAAGIHNAQATYYVDGQKAAVKLLRAADAEIAALLTKDQAGHVGLDGDVQDVLRGLRAIRANPLLIRPTELLSSDWTANGNYYWLRQQIARQLTQWEKS